MLNNQKIWHKLKQLVNDKQLKEIAANDGWAFDEHLEALKTIYNSDQMPKRLIWEPAEALELTRWSDYREAAEYFSEPTVVLFCTIVLLASFYSQHESNCEEAVNENLIIALDIVELLGGKWIDDYAQFLESLIHEPNLTIERIEDGYFYLHLARLLTVQKLGDEKQIEIAMESVCQAEIDFKHYESSFGCSDNFKKDIFSYMIYDQKMSLWHKHMEPFESKFSEFREAYLSKRLRTRIQNVWSKPLNDLFQNFD